MDITRSFSAHLMRPAPDLGHGRLAVWLLPEEATAGVSLMGGGRLLWCSRTGVAPGPDGWGRLEVPIDEVPLHPLWQGGEASIVTAAHPYPVATFDPAAVWGRLCGPEYAASIASAVPDNHWRLDYAMLDGDAMTVTGWVVRPPGSPTPDIRLNGEQATVHWRLPHPDPTTSHWFVPGSEASGFVATARVDPAGDHVRVDWRPDGFGPATIPRPFVVGLGLFQRIVAPDLPRIQRVSGPQSSTISYVNEGLGDTLSLLDVATRFGIDPADPTTRILEWGCGCGRMTQHLLDLPHASTRLVGVDIDDDNVRWCAANLPGRYVTAPLEPPVAEIADGSADLIVSHSVLTHLRPDTARRWLAEIARWLSPEGMAVLTFNGESSTLVMNSRHPDRLSQILSAGIDATTASSDLTGVVDADYYRVTVGTDTAMRDLMSESLEVVAVVPAVTSGFQNAAVLRRPGGHVRAPRG